MQLSDLLVVAMCCIKHWALTGVGRRDGLSKANE